MSNQFHLLKERRFRPFFLTTFLAAFSDNAFMTAFVTLITFRAGQLTSMDPKFLATLLPGLFILPFFLFSATSGQIADKCDKATLTRWVRILQVPVMALAAWGFMGNRFWPLVAVLVLMGVQSTVFGPVKYAYLPQHLRPTELMGGNGLMEMGTFVAILLGEVLGAALATLPRGGLATLPRGGLATSVTLMLIALLGLWTSWGVPASPPADPRLKIDWNPVTGTWRNLRDARDNRVVWLSLLGISWFWFFGATLLAQFPTFSKEVLGGNENVFILLLAVFSLGIGLGSLLCERLSGHKVDIGLVPFGALGLTLFGVDLYLAARGGSAPAGLLDVRAFLGTARHWRLMADLVLLGLFGGFFIVPLYALIQIRGDRSRQSRTIAANSILNSLFMVASAGVSMLLFKAGLDIPQLFLAAALFNLVVALYIVALVPEFLARFVSWLLVHSVYRLRAEHAERIPEEGPALLVCTYVSRVDVLLVFAASPRPIHFILDERFFRVPLLGSLLRLIKAIPVGPDPATLEHARREMRRAFAEGDLVALFPEGEGLEEGGVGVFEDHLAPLVAESTVAMLPIALGGALWGSHFSRKGPSSLLGALGANVSVRVGMPLEPGAAPETLRGVMQGLA